MDINITHTMSGYQFENRENLRNAAKNILNKQGASEEGLQKIIDKTIFESDKRLYPNAQLAVLKASAQISMNGKLKETLKYIKKHPVKKVKEPVLGELWNIFSNDENSTYDDTDSFEVDYSMENIFAAA